MARKTRSVIALVLSAFLAFGTIPAPALAEMAEGAMGEEPVAAQVTRQDETRGKDVTASDAGLAPMAEEGASAETSPDEELAATPVAELAAQDDAAPDELGAADVPEGEAAADGEPVLSVQSVGQLYNPRVFAKSGMRSGQMATWDCVWLGSYPQTEVSETAALRTASWKDNDATVGGVRYRRISKADVSNTFNVGDFSGWRYFRYEPIKWRILKVNGDTAFAVADKALDCRQYHVAWTRVTWETSTVRSWLNGTGSVPYYSIGAQSGRTAQAFTTVAFTSDQLGAVRQSTIANASNTLNGTPGGNTTTDRVFLLSESEVHGASATAHGFASNPNTDDEGRECGASDYALAMGSLGIWWLRSPGDTAEVVSFVSGGSVDRGGDYSTLNIFAVRPALKLNLSSPHLTWAGTVSSDGTVNTNAKPGSVPPLSDVVEGSWYEGVVMRATKLGLMSGYPNGRFGPADKITRGQVAVTLWNMAGNPAAGSGAKTFTDVGSSDYYYNAVRWASSKGVVSGYGNGRFGPKDNVSREEFAVMLANYARNVKGRVVTGSKSDFSSMRDKDKVSGWAVSSVGWCFKNQILSGSGGNVNPGGNASRAEAAKMVVVLYDLLG